MLYQLYQFFLQVAAILLAAGAFCAGNMHQPLYALLLAAAALYAGKKFLESL